MLLMSCLRRVYQRSHRFTPKLSSKSFVLLSLTFRSMIHSDLIFVLWCEVRVQLHSFLCRYPYVPVPFVKKTFLSLLKCLGIFVKNQQTLSERIYFCTFQFYSIDLSCLYFYQYQSWLLKLCSTFWIKKHEFSNFLLFQNSFSYSIWILEPAWQFPQKSQLGFWQRLNL